MNLKQKWISISHSFWFVPGLIVLGFCVMAVMAIEAESLVPSEYLTDYPRLFGAGADGARGMLSTIAGSIMSMMGVTFSMTLVALTLASSQYTSRILRNFMSSKTTQVVLGLMSGIFTYSLIILRTIRGGDQGGFVPTIAVFVGFLLAVVGVVALILFIHHMASSIQASTILETISVETINTINHVFRDDLNNQKLSDKSCHDSERWRSVASVKTGYLQSIDESRLMSLAEEWKTVIRLPLQVGEFIIENCPVVQVDQGFHLTDEKRELLLSTIYIDAHRTIEQDPFFGIRQIVDIALKALSPGVNDTTTAIMSIDYLTAILATLIKKQLPEEGRYEGSTLLLITKTQNFEDFYSLSFNQILESGKDNLAVVKHVINSCKILNSISRDKKDQVLFLEEKLNLLQQYRCLKITY